MLLSSVFLARSGVITSITASLAVNQLSDDIVISSLSREQAKKKMIDRFLGGTIALSIGGIFLSCVPKKRKEKNVKKNV